MKFEILSTCVLAAAGVINASAPTKTNERAIDAGTASAIAIEGHKSGGGDYKVPDKAMALPPVVDLGTAYVPAQPPAEALACHDGACHQGGGCHQSTTCTTTTQETNCGEGGGEGGEYCLPGRNRRHARRDDRQGRRGEGYGVFGHRCGRHGC